MFELNNIYKKEDIEHFRTPEEFIDWFEFKLKERRNFFVLHPEAKREFIEETKDSKKESLAKFIKEELGDTYHLMKNKKEAWQNYKFKNIIGCQPFDIKVLGHPQIDYIEITRNHDELIANKKKGMSENGAYMSPMVTYDDGKLQEITNSVKKAIQKKADKTYPEKTALFVRIETGILDDTDVLPLLQLHIKNETQFVSIFIIGTDACEKLFFEL